VKSCYLCCINKKCIGSREAPLDGSNLEMLVQFFHATATIRYRKKMITMLKTVDGKEAYSHITKAEILWEAYKERLGATNPVVMPANLEELIQASQDLGVLETPFTHEEIDNVVKSLASDKTPGPDGFNNDY
jgi:hypothetical protein